MKTHIALVLALSLILSAATIIDTDTTDFQPGTPNNVNISNDQLALTQTGGLYALTGSFQSQIRDLGSNPDGEIIWSQTGISGTSVILRTRSGSTPAYNTNNWSSWGSAYTASTGSPFTSPINRYWQYRVELATNNQANTPTVASVIYDYQEQGPLIQETTNTNLTETSTGAYDYEVTITDTLPLTTQQARHRIGSDSYSSWQNINETQPDTYEITIPEPTNNWSSRRSENLDIQIRATNNQSNTTTQTFSEEIDQINQPVTIQSISDQTATEGEEFTLVIQADDPDNDNLVFTSNYGSLTQLNNSAAELRWTPTYTEIGTTNFEITVSDNEFQDQTQFSVNTAGKEHEPVIQPVNNRTAYYGDQINWTIRAVDQNTNDNLTFNSTPTLIWQPANNTATNNYSATASHVALDNYRGETQFTFRVQDAQGNQDETTATLQINYCGDNICQSNEDETTCSQDCQEEAETLKYLAIEFEDRICANQTTTITVYNASSRYICFNQGQTISGAAYCQPRQGVDIAIYGLQQTPREEITTAYTGSNGTYEFTPELTGRYRAVATEEDFETAESTFTAAKCTERMLEDNIIEYEAPDITASQRPTPPAREETPQPTPQERNLIAIFLFYVLTPLLAAALVYLGTEYYQVNKETDPHILAARIRMIEWRKKIAPYIQPYAQKIKHVAEPLTKAVQTYIISPVKKLFKSIKRK